MRGNLRGHPLYSPFCPLPSPCGAGATSAIGAVDRIIADPTEHNPDPEIAADSSAPDNGSPSCASSCSLSCCSSRQVWRRSRWDLEVLLGSRGAFDVNEKSAMHTPQELSELCDSAEGRLWRGEPDKVCDSPCQGESSCCRLSSPPRARRA